jgi:hypothetical protein
MNTSLQISFDSVLDAPALKKDPLFLSFAQNPIIGHKDFQNRLQTKDF